MSSDDCTTSCTCKPHRLPPTSSYRPSHVMRQTPTQTERPQGQPGTYRAHDGNTVDVILDLDGLIWCHVHTGTMTEWLWVPMRGWDVDHFESDPDVPAWVADCPHDPVCFDGRDQANEAACVALRVEQGSESWGA